MNSTKRVLLVSASMVLLCLCIIVGATYALFTDSATVHNHLQAGDLDLRFERTYLEYTKLDEEGFMQKFTETNPVDFTNSNIDFSKSNIFGFEDKDANGKERVIVPGSYVRADLKISNDGNVAFDYEAFILLKEGTDTALAKQLLVTVTDKKTQNVLVNAEPLNFMVASTQVPNGYKITFGEDIGKSDSAEFTVVISFADDEVNNTVGDNDLAQTQSVAFDLYVSAVQSTSAPANP